MGAPADNGPDRDAAPERETPVDDAWTNGTSMHDDQTTAGLQVDAASLDRSAVAGTAAGLDHDRTTSGLDPELVAPSSEHDRTVVAPYAEQNARAVTEGSSAALDATIAELKRANAVPDHDRTTLGVSAETPKPRAGVTLLQPGKGKVSLEKERVLAQPERSPLELVMRDLEPAAPVRAHASGDSSRFVAALVGDQPPPPRIEAEPVDLNALRPVARRSSRGRWIAAGALAVTAMLGSALAWKLTGAGETPAEAASEAAKVIETPAAVPAAEPVPPPSNVAAPSAASDPRDLRAAVDPGQASAASAPTEVPAPPAPDRGEADQPSEAAPVPARTAVIVATASESAVTSAAPKSSSLAKTSKAESAVTKKPSAGKAVAKTPAPAKKATAAKTTTAKKTTAKKTTATKTAAAKKPTTSKKSTVAKKSTTKKTSTPKSSRAQPNGRRPRRS